MVKFSFCTHGQYAFTSLNTNTQISPANSGANQNAFDVVFGALKDNTESFDNYEKANGVYELRKELLKATEENLKISLLTYKNGVIDYLDVLDAQRSNANAKQDLCSAVNALQKARIRVYESLGGDWVASVFVERTEKRNRKEPIQ